VTDKAEQPPPHVGRPKHEMAPMRASFPLWIVVGLQSYMQVHERRDGRAFCLSVRKYALGLLPSCPQADHGLRGAGRRSGWRKPHARGDNELNMRFPEPREEVTATRPWDGKMYRGARPRRQNVRI